MNIKTFSSSVFLILTTGLCIPHVGAQCTTTPPKVPTAVTTTIVSTSYVIYQCFYGIFYTMFSTGDFVLSSSCTGVTWSTIGGTCEFTIALFRCSPTGPVVPQSAVLLKDGYPAYKAYVCGTGLRWLSGSFVRISQCNNTQWTPIIDICEDAVTPLPRDCSDIFDLGFTTNGNYYAVTSGNAALPYLLTPITCQMNDSTYGTRWTYVLNNTLPIPLAITKASYLNGYAGTHLFLGLQALSALSLDHSGHLQGMILQVLLNVSIPSLSVYQVFHATFDNFTIGSAPNYSLVSLGNYYGNAGDGLTPHIGKTFNTTFPAWWGVNAPTEAMAIMGSILTGSTMTWAPILSVISDSTIIRAEMKIRPYRVDYGSFCPATFGAWPSWLSTTEGFVPVSRLPGSVLTYQCVNPYLEGAPGGPTTSSGNITCLNTLPPTWTKFPNLPCTIHCPAGFVFSYDKTSCLYYSTDVQTFVNASLACLDLNSSLATFNDTLDLSGNYSTSTLYYTGYSQRGSSQLSIQPPIPSFLSCLDASCLTYSLPQCVQMFGNGSYTLQTSCLDERNYVCKLSDPYCPPSFWKADGGCYTFISSSSSALDYLLACESLGASLAYPTSTNQTYAISNGLIVNQGVSSSYALIGANNVNGNWTDDGTFMVQSDLLSLLEVGTDPYRLMYVNPDGSYLFQAISLPTSVSYSGAICQYYGPIGCSLNPPLPTENMTYNWNGSLATGSIIDYTCKVGYFVNGNISWNIQSVQCMGILGGWVPSNFLPCLSAPVCENSTIVTSSPLVTNVTTSDSFFINGSMTFQCPPNMAFADGNTTLNAYCDGNASQYLFLPSVIPSCSVCSGVPQNISNATTNYDPTVSYAINDTIIVTCADGYMTGYGLQSQTMPCHETGWNMTYVGCRNSCSYYPPVNGAFTVSNYTATSSNKIGTKITLECASEYYFLQNYHNQALNTTATITCSSWGHWYSNRFGVSLECAKMCVANPPLPKDNANNTWNGYSRNNGSKINITCHDGYLLENFQSDVTIKCLFPAWGADSLTNFNCSEACMTLLPTSFANATTNWTTFGIVGSQATYNCNPGYYTPNGSTEFVATCLATVGWSFSTDDYCVEAVIPICAPDPPAAPANGTSSWDGISYQNGTNITYTCPNGDLFTIACEAPAWQTISLTNFTCMEVCSGNPPTDPANAISSWDGISYQNGTKVTYACLNGYLFGNYQLAITIACEAPDWQTISLTNFTCTEACLSLPPEIFANATTNWTTFGVVGSQVIYSCNPGYMTASGLAYFVATCQATVGWFFPPASSFCKQACLVPVLSMNSSAIMKYNGNIEGSTANYTCARGFSTTVQVTFITSTCTNGTWIPSVIPNCCEFFDLRVNSNFLVQICTQRKI